jgi:hypothetical protein
MQLEMRMAVDHTGQQGQLGQIDRLVPGGICKPCLRADKHNAIVFNRDNAVFDDFVPPAGDDFFAPQYTIHSHPCVFFDLG